MYTLVTYVYETHKYDVDWVGKMQNSKVKDSFCTQRTRILVYSAVSTGFNFSEKSISNYV
jgi:hypothetical protein